MTRNVAVLGGAWGDEGKGKVVHQMSPDFDWVIRTSGSSNCGHTIYRDKVKFVHNLVPSVDWRALNTKAFIGSGTVIDLQHLIKETLKAEEVYAGISKRIYVDPDAFLILPEHIEEDKAKNGHIGTTNKGVGPAYASKVSRKGFRIKDVILGKETTQKPFYDQLVAMGVQFKHVLELEEEFKSSNLLFEGAQGVMLDLNVGVYPYVSCGDACVSGILNNGFYFAKLDKVYGVIKAYTTKVGEGPFPTEYFGEEAETLRAKGNEVGAVTKRPRRVGALDLAAANYACKKGGITSLIVTKFDILDGEETVKVCTEYKKVPVSPSDFFSAEPVYREIKGWQNSHDVSQLSEIIALIEDATQTPVEYVSCGVEDADFIKL